MAKVSDTHIRVRKSDSKLWGEYCKNLGVPSPILFNKIITSENIKLNERVLQELQKKEESFRRRVFRDVKR